MVPKIEKKNAIFHFCQLFFGAEKIKKKNTQNGI